MLKEEEKRKNFDQKIIKVINDEENEKKRKAKIEKIKDYINTNFDEDNDNEFSKGISNKNKIVKSIIDKYKKNNNKDLYRYNPDNFVNGDNKNTEVNKKFNHSN